MFLESQQRPWTVRQQIERQGEVIEGLKGFLANTVHQIAFVGDVGLGKSTALSVLSGLTLPDRSLSLAKRVVLDTASGRTTLCEVSIRHGREMAVSVAAMPNSSFVSLCRDFCRLVWDRQAGREGSAEDLPSLTAEAERAIRNMADLKVSRKTGAQGEPVRADAALELANNCKSIDEFVEKVVARVKPELRTRTMIRMTHADLEGQLSELKEVFAAVNKGQLADVPYPFAIEVVVPCLDVAYSGLDISFIDTKGMDENAIRTDLDKRLRDPRTHVVLCSSFNQAPNLATRAVIAHLHGLGDLAQLSGKASMLVLPRAGEAENARDEIGEPAQDALEGCDFKRGQIVRQLAESGEASAKLPILFFNAAEDDPAPIRQALLGEIVKLREVRAEQLQEACALAAAMMADHEELAMELASLEVQKRLQQFRDAHLELPVRVKRPQSSLVKTLESVRHASSVWALARRNGCYGNIDLHVELDRAGRHDARYRAAVWFSNLTAVLASLLKDGDLAPAWPLVRQTQRQLDGWKTNFEEAAGEATAEHFLDALANDCLLWSECAAQWGQGQGFKARVVARVDTWFAYQAPPRDELETLIEHAWQRCVLDRIDQLCRENPPQTLLTHNGNVIPFRRLELVD